ncbi:hypothetical protein B0T26DRAFT_653071 [Lasiosphaeria miniovina]|uniref:EKC/KEOPS complex subunit GON7 n=1 Tax=Lasiosphaeria miniovina TaxID=1954250 RepID=A0AA40A489_9PEZI|nr:uncharacterized protein B0T26DRAFT_653071 [Lasiosphaeria miniovina]KAK0708976.1 hypothetical protein B0T26DRAFT_653071 [Lasiosphaeria miniovina]
MPDQTLSSASALTAVYTSKGNNEPFSTTQAFAPPADGIIESRTSYLRSVRIAVVGLQEQVNQELTARMEEDNSSSGNSSSGSLKTAKFAVDDVEEEENYGEEVQEEDDA